MSARSLAAAALIALAFSGVWLGCGASQPPAQPVPSSGVDEARARECNELITIINLGAENINRIGDGGAEYTESDLLTMATALETAAARAAALTLTVPALRQGALEYRDMATRFAAHARNLAATMLTKDLARIEAASLATQSAGEPEERIIQTINVLCAAP